MTDIKVNVYSNWTSFWIDIGQQDVFVLSLFHFTKWCHGSSSYEPFWNNVHINRPQLHNQYSYITTSRDSSSVLCIKNYSTNNTINHSMSVQCLYESRIKVLNTDKSKDSWIAYSKPLGEFAGLSWKVCSTRFRYQQIWRDGDFWYEGSLL